MVIQILKEFERMQEGYLVSSGIPKDI